MNILLQETYALLLISFANPIAVSIEMSVFIPLIYEAKNKAES